MFSTKTSRDVGMGWCHLSSCMENVWNKEGYAVGHCNNPVFPLYYSIQTATTIPT